METSINIKKMIGYSEGGITSKVVLSGENNQVTLFCMAEGTDIGEHTSAKKGFVYVIEGGGIFNLEGREIIMESGVLINMSKNAKHSLSANKNTSFLLFLTD